ncbi:MAG: SDR family oxidoreductase [Planctomycetes bacterium]|nr:SDR family oxidoreductase [Planctomycetota bacterium]
MTTEVCLITGGSRGIGLATALRFARAGWHSVIVARHESELAQAHAQISDAGGEVRAVVADVGTPAGTEEMVAAARDAFGRVDVLVNNAGYAPLAPTEELSREDFDRAIATNVSAVFHGSRTVWPLMRSQGGGVIVNVSSISSVDPFLGFGVYGACKAWVNLFTQALAAEGRPVGIRAFAVAPGMVETQMLRSRFPDVPSEQTLAPDDVAAVIETVCAEHMRYATGQTIFVRK